MGAFAGRAVGCKVEEKTRMNNVSRLSDAELTTLRDLIYHKTGIFYTDRNRYLLDARAHEALRENGSRNTASYLDVLARTNITSPE